MKKIIIAIDGFSGCGKSTTAKKVAQELQYTYVDSGAMYRTLTLYCIQNQINVQDIASQLETILPQIDIKFVYNEVTQKNHIWLNDKDVENEIRKMYVSDKVSQVSAIPQVRKALVKMQQKLGERKGIVMDGRDIGTTVFPHADLKIFMNADILVRAERRQKELLAQNQIVELQDIIKNLQERDLQDTTRQESPLRKAEDAYYLDTTHISFEQQVDFILQLAQQKIAQINATDKENENTEKLLHS
ncbi:MAG: (d)CMP kinase [Microscillaceae bacterium]|nr:(d)CMP kinase [Microscillaceae bacterium]MDW8461235.1 (d)CMP kinase [Cytophagales bacterium]